MSSSAQKPEGQEAPDSPRTNPLDAYIPRQSQLVRFQKEGPRDGNALVSLPHSSRGVKSSIEYHEARAAQAIGSFQQTFAKKTPSGSYSATEESKPSPKPERS
ncbi:hypothetical protein CT0861_08621 [Colletotrichum tofieldiae]|uniref:Uncharacterized protein n=1 Tax=Colletotrichum tofieldiae TaxID=708197 RepID=A0A166YBX3_9PEZI|nr:hypothetical protein CT0861_08621 [Colletotrichum tofieldiae]